MKAKKALKKLNKVEALLSNVMEGFPGGKEGLENLLGEAKVSIVKAIKTVTSTGAGNNGSPARVRKARNGRLSEEGRKRISLAAKKRWAAAKRKGVTAVPGR